MKRSFYKIVSFFVAVCIVISAVPIFALVSANENNSVNISDAPQLPDNYDLIISEEGVKSNFGSKYNVLPSNTKNTISPSLNLANASTIEFDIYVESVDNLKIAISGYSGNKAQSLLFAFSSASVSALFASQQTATIDITSYIVNDGWNHISVSKTDFEGANIKWDNVRYAFLKFADSTNTAYSAASKLENNNIALANICTVLSAPKSDAILYSELYKNNLGTSDNSLVSDISGIFTKCDLEKVSFEGKYYVFADFKVSDFESFSEFLQNKKLCFKLYSDEAVATVELDATKIISSGNIWKKLKICVDEFNADENFKWDSVNGFSFGISATDSNGKLNEYYSLELFIGYVYSSVDNPSRPEMANKYTTVAKYYESMNSGVLTDKFNFELAYSNNTNPFDLTGAGLESYTYSTVQTNQKNDYFDCIEFDLYVEDADLFVSALKSKNNTLKLSFYSNGMTEDANGVVLSISADEIANLVKRDGWNHIVIDAYDDLVKISNTCNFDFAKVTGWKLSFGGTASNINIANGNPIQIANIATTLKQMASPEISNKYDTVSTYYTDMSYGVLGNDFNFALSYTNTATPFDFTASGLDKYTYKTVHETDKENKYFNYIEFDIYIDDVNEFKNACKTKDNIITLKFNSNALNGSNDCVYAELSLNEMSRFLVNDGWNHIVIESFIGIYKDNSTEDFDFTKVTGWTLCFGGTLTNVNSAEGQLIEIANICTTVNKVEKPAVNNKHKLVTEYYTEMITKTCGYDFSWQKIIGHNENPIDWTDSGVDSYTIKNVIQKDFVNRYFDTLEFDFYVADVSEFCSALSAKENKIRLRFYTNAVAIGESNLLDIRFTGEDFANLLTQDGWNHITIETDKFTYKGTPDFTKVTSWLIDFVGTLSNYNGAAGQKIAIANLCITDDESKPNTLEEPELPENVITEINEESSHALGAYFGYTSDRIFAEGIGPYDFSKGNSIEFDLYVSDYETLKKSFEECPRGSELYIVFSSVPLNLFSQYSKPRTYYSVQSGLREQITKTGWNHIKLGKADFSQLLGNMDWSNVTSFMLRYSKSKFNQSDEEEKNPAGEVRVKITNIVNTGIISDVPYDEKKSERPDKNAVYINDAENLVDDNGSWNPSDVYSDENYKSENAHSVLRKFSYLTEIDFARMFYLFDYSADISDIKTLKFDLFVDIPQFIQKNGNVIEVGFSSKRNLEGSYTWKIDTSTLKEGWNSLSFDISKAQKSGKVSLDEIKTFFIRFSEINLSAEDYETVIIGIDNLRYLSKNGNTTLRINGLTDDVEVNEDININNDYDFDNNNSNEEVQEVITETKTHEPKTFHQKETVHKTVTNYTVAIIILCAEFAVLTAASIIAFVILKKKKKI